jgi:hypothetical protein
LAKCESASQFHFSTTLVSGAADNRATALPFLPASDEGHGFTGC